MLSKKLFFKISPMGKSSHKVMYDLLENINYKLQASRNRYWTRSKYMKLT